MSTIQFIENDGKREYAILPYPLFERLSALIEEVEDHQSLESFRQQDDGFRIPETILRRELAGESPLKLWREYRGLTQEQLVIAAELTCSTLETLEITPSSPDPKTIPDWPRC